MLVSVRRMHSLRLLVTLTAMLVSCAASLAAESSVRAFQSKDVRVVLSVSDAKFKIGQPIPYEIKVTNLGHTTISYMRCWAWRIEPGYLIEISDKSGKALPQPKQARVTSVIGGDAKIEAGGTAIFKGYLNQWADLSAEGAYTAKTSWSSFMYSTSPKSTSAPVKLVIEKATEAERDKILADARSQLREASTLEEMQDAIWTLAYTLDVRAIPDLVRAGQDINVSQDAESALLRFSNRTDVEDELLKQLRDHGPSEPLAYALSHLKVPADKTLPQLKLWLQQGSSEQRADALLALSMIPERYADSSLREPILAQIADKDTRVRHHAVLALGDGSFGNTLDAVMGIAKNDPDIWVREQAIIAVGWHKDDRAIPLLKQLAKDKNAAISRAAIEALRKIGSPTATSALAECAHGQRRDGRQ